MTDLNNLNEFENICRTCMSECDLKFTNKIIIHDVYYKLTGIQFDLIEDLPQQICLKCFEKINNIIEFSLQCKEVHSKLTKHLDYYKKLLINKIEFINIQETNTLIKLEPCEEEFINDDELKIKIEIPNDDFVPKTSEVTNLQNLINSIPIDVPPKRKRYIPTIRKHKCDFCNKVFVKSNALKIHKRIHTGERPFVCQICNKGFVGAQALNVHKRIHSEERPFKCDVCPLAFKLPWPLHQHKRRHSGERPYKCDKCPETFAYLNAYKNHQDKHNNELRPCKHSGHYKCDWCPKVFKHAYTLKVHKREHSGERPYLCDQCTQTFTNSQSLRIHKLNHSGERPFLCNICPKRFFERKSLKIHLIKHCDVRPFICDICKKTFKFEKSLYNHKKICE